MKILCVIDNLGPGGAQRQLVELGRGFKERGHYVFFLTYYDLPFFKPVLDQAGIQYKCIQEENPIRRFFKIRHFLRRGGFDGIISFLEGANFYCECAGIPFRRWKLIVGERLADPRIYKSFKLRGLRWFHLFADYVVANSKANIEIVRKINPILPEKKLRVIYNIVDFHKWKPVPGFNYKGEKLKLVISASHIYRKNLNGLIEGLLRLKKNQLNKLSIEWYGDRICEPYYDSSYSEVLDKIAGTEVENVISFFSATEEIEKKIKKASAIGLFSFVEGLPNVVCEGMACAKPIICSDISDVSDLLSKEKNLLFDPADSNTIRESLKYLIDMSEEELKKAGEKNAQISREIFNRDNIINDYLHLLSI